MGKKFESWVLYSSGSCILKLGSLEAEPEVGVHMHG